MKGFLDQLVNKDIKRQWGVWSKGNAPYYCQFCLTNPLEHIDSKCLEIQRERQRQLYLRDPYR